MPTQQEEQNNLDDLDKRLALLEAREEEHRHKMIAARTRSAELAELIHSSKKLKQYQAEGARPSWLADIELGDPEEGDERLAGYEKEQEQNASRENELTGQVQELEGLIRAVKAQRIETLRSLVKRATLPDEKRQLEGDLELALKTLTASRAATSVYRKAPYDRDSMSLTDALREFLVREAEPKNTSDIVEGVFHLENLDPAVHRGLVKTVSTTLWRAAEKPNESGILSNKEGRRLFYRAVPRTE